jgi:hypothetical protein
MMTRTLPDTAADLPAETLKCGYCGHETGDTDLHEQLYALLSEFRHQHDGTWQCCHEYASRIEAVVLQAIVTR